MEFSARHTAEGRVLLSVKGDMDLYSQNELREVYNRKIQGLDRDLILSLEQVGYLDSSGVGCLIHLYKLQKEKKKALYLVKLQNPVLKVIQLTRLDQVLPIFRSMEDLPPVAGA